MGDLSFELSYWTDILKTNPKLLSELMGRYHQYFKKYFSLNNDFIANKKILDVGCGPNCSFKWAVGAFGIGLDHLMREYNLEFRLTEHEDFTRIAAKMEHMPFRDSVFDIVSSINSLDHVDDTDASIKEITRVLKKDGLFLLITEINGTINKCEPNSLKWNIDDIVVEYGYILVMKECYDKHHNGIYSSISTDTYRVELPIQEQKGVLLAKFKKIRE